MKGEIIDGQEITLADHFKITHGSTLEISIDKEAFIQGMKEKFVKDFGSLKWESDSGYFMAGFVADYIDELNNKTEK